VLVSEGVTVAVTDHAAERFRQRVGSRLGGFDVKPEIAGRVSEAWTAGRVSETPPPGASEQAARTRKGTGGSVYVRDLVDRGVIFVCRHDRAARELLVITLWEDERFGKPRVDHRFTDALKDDDRALVDPGRRWRERRDGTA
jgi:hypothetical protein